jgi:hypothetical protein
MRGQFPGNYSASDIEKARFCTKKFFGMKNCNNYCLNLDPDPERS